MTHTHFTPEDQAKKIRAHLREDHGDPNEYKGSTGRALVWVHAQQHPDHVVVDVNWGILGPKPDAVTP